MQSFHTVNAQRSHYLGVALVLIATQLLTTERAVAAVEGAGYFGSNYYEFVTVTDPYAGNNNSWFTASIAAAASLFNGVNGHLATVTSQAENDFMHSLAAGLYTDFTGAWLGGKAPEGWLEGPENGLAFSYTNWVGIEPNNAGYAYMSVGMGYGEGGLWADDSLTQGVPSFPNDPVIGYFVEYENAAVVPVPAGLVLLGSGLLGLAGLRRQ